MHCIYLNTAARVDRREWMEEQLTALGWSYERLECVPQEPDAHGFMNVALRSCWLSHEAAIEKAAARSGLTLILEDDVKVLNPERVEYIVATINENPWDIQYFYGSGGRALIENVYRCHAYIIRPALTQRVLRILRDHRREIEIGQPKDGQTLIDGHFRWMQRRCRFWGTEDLIIQDRERFGSDTGWGWQGRALVN